MRASRDRPGAPGDRDQSPDGRTRAGDGRAPAALRDLPATSDERRASGKAARKRAGRGSLGSWDEEDRRHDALETILAQNRIRVPELVPIRHHRMAASPWNYYRGAAAVMAADLASQPGAMFAATNPQRISALVLSAMAFITTPAAVIADPAQMQLLWDTIEQGWGNGHMLDLAAPGHADDPRLRTWWRRWERQSAPPLGGGWTRKRGARRCF